MYDHSLSLFFFSKMLAVSLTHRIATGPKKTKRKKHCCCAEKRNGAAATRLCEHLRFPQSRVYHCNAPSFYPTALESWPKPRPAPPAPGARATPAVNSRYQQPRYVDNGQNSQTPEEPTAQVHGRAQLPQPKQPKPSSALFTAAGQYSRPAVLQLHRPQHRHPSELTLSPHPE